MPSSARLVGGASRTSRLVRVGSRPGLAVAANLDPLAARERLGHAVEDRVDHHLGVAAREAREELQHLVDQVALGHARAHWGSGPDRKSTRLNSSHSQISYA